MGEEKRRNGKEERERERKIYGRKAKTGEKEKRV